MVPLVNSKFTSGFWPRVRARALRAPVFLSSLPPPNGALRAPLPACRNFAASYLTPKNTENLCPPSRPSQLRYSFRQYLGSKVYTRATIRKKCFRFFFSLVFGSFPFVSLFFFFSPFQFLIILLFLSLHILLVGLFFVFFFVSSYILNCLSYYMHAY